MIHYNFYSFVNYFSFIDSDAYSYYNTLKDHLTYNPDKDDLIELLWNQVKSFQPLRGLQEEIGLLKSDVLWSVYASLYYTTSSALPFKTIFNNYISSDPALKDHEDSINSERSNLSQIKAIMIQEISSKTPSGRILSSGQLIENNALLYFLPYCEEENQQIKIFNSSDFIKYIKGYSHWPYTPQNQHGMDLYSYFNFIKDAFEYNMNTKESDFNCSFSSYIMEQIFYPMNFIRNIKDFIVKTDNHFFDKKFRREQSIVLLYPLFHMPSFLYDIIVNEYYTNLIQYIENPNSISEYFNFKAIFDKSVFYKNVLYPFLQSLFSYFLYYIYDNNLGKAADKFKCYIEKNHSDFNLHSPLKTAIKNLDDIKYTGKSIGITSQNKDKRSNETIKSFEVNFSYYFFVVPQYHNFFQYRKLYGISYSINNYLTWIEEQLWNRKKYIGDPVSTPNYIQYNHDKAEYSLYMM